MEKGSVARGGNSGAVHGMLCGGVSDVPLCVRECACVTNLGRT